MGKISKVKKKSIFQQEIIAAQKNEADKALSTEERKEKRYAKLDAIFEEIADKKNRYLFYCPDIPFACSMVKIIYEYAYRLQNAGFTVRILHEVKGFKPDWLDTPWKKDLTVIYMSEKKNNKMTTPEVAFKPTDTIIIPDGFWTVMKNLYDIKTLHKVVLAFGYGGVITSEPGVNWGHLGFMDVICMSQKIADDYKVLWPRLSYYTIGYEIDLGERKSIPRNEIKPVIGIMARDREDASMFINIFYSRYPFLDMFEFKILKKLNTTQYVEALEQCAAMVLVDDQAGHPAPPIEAIALDVQTIGVYGRGLEHLKGQEGVYLIQVKDLYLLAEEVAGFCLDWIKNPTKEIKNKKIIKNYHPDKVIVSLINTFDQFQEVKIKKFAAVRTAVDDGKLSDSQLDTE
jgi:hypothetical protein